MARERRRIRRRPPVVEAPPESSECELPEEIDGLLAWSELTSNGKSNIIQQWVSRSWSSLAEFCVLKGVQYQSIREALQRRGIPTVGSRQSDLYEKELMEAARQVVATLNGIHANLETVQQQIYRRLLSRELTLVELLKAGAALSEHAKGASISMEAVADAMAKLGLGKEPTTEAVGEASRTAVPPEVQRQYDNLLSHHAEQIVRQQQQG